MRTPIHLEIPSQDVVIGGETFTLREHSARKLGEYLQLQVDSATEARQAAPEASIDALVDGVIERDNRVLRFLLGKDDAWIEEHLVPSLKRRVLEIQNELDGLDRLQGDPGNG